MNAIAKKSLAHLAAAAALALAAPAFADNGRHGGWEHEHYRQHHRHHHDRHYAHEHRPVYVQEYRPVRVEPVYYYEAPRPEPYAVINVPPIVVKF
jgi:hypothetical protein